MKRIKKSIIAGVVVVIIIVVLDNLMDTEFTVRLTILLERPSNFIMSAIYKIWIISHIMESLVQLLIDLLFFTFAAFVVLIITDKVKLYFTSRRRTERP